MKNAVWSAIQWLFVLRQKVRKKMFQRVFSTKKRGWCVPSTKTMWICEQYSDSLRQMSEVDPGHKALGVKWDYNEPPDESVMNLSFNNKNALVARIPDVWFLSQRQIKKNPFKATVRISKGVVFRNFNRTGGQQYQYKNLLEIVFCVCWHSSSSVSLRNTHTAVVLDFWTYSASLGKNREFPSLAKGFGVTQWAAPVAEAKSEVKNENTRGKLLTFRAHSYRLQREVNLLPPALAGTLVLTL